MTNVNNQRVLCRYNLEIDRSEGINGLFIANLSDVEKIIGEHVCFYEVFERHSEIKGVIDENEIIILSKDDEFINKLEETATYRKSLKSITISGVSPFDYLADKYLFDE